MKDKYITITFHDNDFYDTMILTAKAIDNIKQFYREVWTDFPPFENIEEYVIQQLILNLSIQKKEKMLKGKYDSYEKYFREHIRVSMASEVGNENGEMIVVPLYWADNCFIC